MSLQHGIQIKATFDPASMDRWIKLLSPVPTRNEATGEEITTWQDEGSCWSAKYPTNGGRLIAADGVNYEQYTSFRMRYRDNVTTGWRIRYNGAEYEIVNTQELGRRHLLDVTTRSINQNA